MMSQRSIYAFISGLAISLCFALTANGQSKIFTIEKDSIPFFNGLSVSVDLAGPAMLALSDYGEYEGALRVNLHDQYFPVFELGYGKANHDDEVTGIRYKTAAPYFRIGCDINLLKKKHTKNRLYGGLRYAFTSYKVDIARPGLQDPTWKWDAPVDLQGEQCRQHWIEAVFGVDAQVWGPLHLGWNVRYKRRIAHKDSSIGNTWYVPGYGVYSDTRIGANFLVIIDI